MKLTKYSFGTGDRFAHQGTAQLQSILKAKYQGVHMAPVWNKSHREHQIIGSTPKDVRLEADRVVIGPRLLSELQESLQSWEDGPLEKPFFDQITNILLKSID